MIHELFSIKRCSCETLQFSQSQSAACTHDKKQRVHQPTARNHSPGVSAHGRLQYLWFLPAFEHNPFDPAVFWNHLAARNPICEQSSTSGYGQRPLETAE